MVSGSYEPILQINLHASGSNMLDPPKKIILLSCELILCGSPIPKIIFLNFLALLSCYAYFYTMSDFLFFFPVIFRYHSNHHGLRDTWRWTLWDHFNKGTLKSFWCSPCSHFSLWISSISCPQCHCFSFSPHPQKDKRKKKKVVPFVKVSLTSFFVHFYLLYLIFFYNF